MTLPVIKFKRISYIISSVLFVTSIVLLATIGLKPGIDFTGGTLMQVQFSEVRPDIAEVQTSLAVLPTLGTVQVQPTDGGSHILKMRFITEDEREEIFETLRNDFASETNSVQQERLDVIGPSISNHLRSRAFTAVTVVIIAIIGYVAYAFRKVSQAVASWKYGITAIIALVHDVVITMGVFTLIGYFFGVEIDIPFVVALLTIIGYSVNDTIVVFDRIREVQVTSKKQMKFDAVIETGVSGTLVRSLNTSLTTLIVLLALFLFGGDSIHYFSLTLMIGIALGTYSSIFLASPLLYEWHTRAKK
jgi:preprotein translocase subunit SecF